MTGLDARRASRFAMYACATSAIAAVAVGCGRSEASTLHNHPGTLLIAAVDISGSRTPSELQESATLLDRAIDRIGNGDRIVVLEMSQGAHEDGRHWDDSIAPLHQWPDTTPIDRRRAGDFRDDAHQTAATFFNPERARTIRTTDVLGTLFRAGEYARDAGGRRVTLLILSDMLNATPELNMEGQRGLPGEDWIAARVKRQIMPDLHNVCVTIAGADVRSSRGAAVRDFWNRYLTAAGAAFRLVNYRNMSSDPGEAACG